jgi:hypothetical protein
MADWRTSSGCKIRPYRSPYGAPAIRHFEESTCAASAVIVRGDVVNGDTVVTTGGLVRLVRGPSSGGDGTNVYQVGIKSLIGVALQGSTSDGSTTGFGDANGLRGMDKRRYLAVALAAPDQEFIGYNSTLETGNGVATQLLVGTNRPLVYDRTHHTFFVASTNSTAALAAVSITEIPEGVIGDSGAFPIIFKFLSSNASPVVPGASQ